MARRPIDDAVSENGSVWREHHGSLVRDVECRDFDQALGVVQCVARGAVDYFRRPDMCISEFNRVRLTVTNPHHAGITLAERRLVEKVDAVLAREGRG
ncbi:MAG: 4a-hydroxytetrahydrobiopterin dehydratase [Solirubrobacterales bacterium]|nr:4a-hydroxytetrahydrobiopterin dehydratase [Solirubrobacterales bacterium]